jgi:cell wall-associated NlpC family hydrolase
MQNKVQIVRFMVVFFVLFTSMAFGQQPPVKDSILKPISAQDSIQAALSLISDSTPRQNNQQVDQIINYAKKFLGTPYRYAGATPSGFDCSGFINYVMGNFGFELTRTSYGLAEYGKTVKLADIRPGDLMFFKGSSTKSTRVGHVALVIEVTPDAIKFIHSSTSRGVVIDNFKTSKYYIPRYITTKRLDYGIED